MSKAKQAVQISEIQATNQSFSKSDILGIGIEGNLGSKV